MVDFSGHVSKAARITRSGISSFCLVLISLDPVRKTKHKVTQTAGLPAPPHKIIQFEFIDESATLMFPSWSFHQRTSTESPTPSVESPNSAFGMLLEAANVNDSESTSSILTPPQSPDGRAMTEIEEAGRAGIFL
jgi:hypothetical protein